MRRKVKKILVLTIGIIFILLGLLGLVLPFLQGILFLIIGFMILSLYFPDVRLWVNEHIKRYPSLFAKIEKIEEWLKKNIGEI